MMKNVSKSGKWSVNFPESILPQSTKDWTSPLNNSEKVITILSFQQWLKILTILVWSSKTQPSLKRELKLIKKIKKDNKKKSKNKNQLNKLNKLLINLKEKLNAFSSKNIQILWSSSNLMVVIIMILPIWPASNIDFWLWTLEESFTLPMLDKENTLKWSLPQLKKLDGLPIKDANIWVSVSSWEKMAKSSLPEKERLSNFLTYWIKPKKELCLNLRAEKKNKS